jgi:hypothetical protein
MTPSYFAKIGEFLFGPSWRRPMSETLEKSYRTILRWEQGFSKIPKMIGKQLAVTCREHGTALIEIADDLEKREK